MSALDIWRRFSADFNGVRAVADAHGVDFCAPQPTVPQRRILHMLEAVADLDPRLIEKSSTLFNWDNDLLVSTLFLTMPTTLCSNSVNERLRTPSPNSICMC